MRLLLGLIALLAPLPAWAGDIAVTLRDKAGKPVANAVVIVYPTAGAAAPRMAGPYVMSQKNITFDPTVLVVPVGARVSFPNYDKVRHHVYSFSPGNRFEFKLYGDEAPSFVFKTVGAAAIGCNIHDQMTAFIRVVDTAYVAKSDASGAAVVRGVPAGAARLVIWQPYLKTRNHEAAFNVVAPDGGTAAFSQVLDLRAAS